MIGYSGDDINKFLWMVRIAEGEHPQDIQVRIAEGEDPQDIQTTIAGEAGRVFPGHTTPANNT